MEKDVSWVPEDEWADVVANSPLVSVDLVIKQDGGFLLGLRENEPAKGEWFVPGGCVLKNERLTEAVHRVADMELGCDVEICNRLGAFEHFYDTSEVDGVDSKHYVANGFVVEPLQPVDVADNQHSELRVFEPPFEDLHPYVQQYVDRLVWD